MIADPFGAFLARVEADYERNRRKRIEPTPKPKHLRDDFPALDDELPGWLVWLVVIVGGLLLGFGLGTALYVYRATH